MYILCSKCVISRRKVLKMDMPRDPRSISKSMVSYATTPLSTTINVQSPRFTTPYENIISYTYNPYSVTTTLTPGWYS